MRTLYLLTIWLLAYASSASAKELRALRVTESPKLDGQLNDAAWKAAEIGGDLRSYEPAGGHAMSESTTFQAVYDQRNLYLGIRCLDSEPDRITAQQMERDSKVLSDDFIYIFLDTFHDQRNGYVFAVNPNAARYDALVTDNVNVDDNWDGIWSARTHRTDQGWTIEIEIPFHGLSFDPASDRWGFNIGRAIQRNNHSGRWVRPQPQVRTHDASVAGDLTGLEGLKSGLGIQVTPYFAGRYRDQENRTSTGDFGGELRYRFTPQLTGTLSYNTDFAEAEADTRQLNFGRFPLFFEEKRNFFLEDGGVFLFGPTASGGSGLRQALVPFFSRRIGLDNQGNPVPIEVAGKLTGREGPYRVGALAVNLDGEAVDDSDPLLVGRVSRDFGQQSTMGIIATHGDPNTRGDAWMVGTDARYRTSNFLGDQTLEAVIYGLQNQTAGATNLTDEAFGGLLRYPNDLVSANIKAMHIGEQFDPSLGFVRRKGVNAYSSFWGIQPRPENLPLIRQIQFAYFVEGFTDLDHTLESIEHTFTPAFIELESGDSIDIEITRNFDAPMESFRLFDQLDVAARDYWWTEAEIDFNFSRKRPINGGLSFAAGEFYDGHRERASADITLNPDARLGLGLQYTYSTIDLPAGELDTHLAALEAQLNLRPDLNWSTLAQYDSVSDSVGINSRVQWEYRPGARTFLVFNQGYDRSEGSFDRSGTEAVIKLGANFLF